MTATAYPERPATVSTPALFGRVMALVALTVGFATLGVWLGRGLGGPGWFIAWLLSLGCLIGLNAANARGQTGLALALLFAFGLLIGGSVATTVNYYSKTDPTAVRQAFGATALFVAALGSGGYAVRRDLSFLYRIAFVLLLGLLGTGIVLIFVQIPARVHRLVAGWPCDLRALHRHRLQSPPPGWRRRGNPAGGGDIPRRPQHLPVLPAALFGRSS